MRIGTPGVFCAAGVALALGGCHLFDGRARSGLPVVETAQDWRNVATDADRKRLRDLRSAWSKALGQVRSSGQGAALVALGPLADPDLALNGAMPPPGQYRCRTIKLGAQAEGMLDFIAYPFFDCAITADGDGRAYFTRTGGSQRQKGLIWQDGPSRAVLLGTVELGDETASRAYGADADRDIAGVIERVGPARWRLALPWPRWESNLDLIELVPAG